jgi:hypothetical protein
LDWFQATIDLVQAIAWPAVAAFALWGLRDLRKPLARTLRNRALTAVRGPWWTGLEFGAAAEDGNGQWLGYEAGVVEVTRHDVDDEPPASQSPRGGDAT